MVTVGVFQGTQAENLLRALRPKQWLMKQIFVLSCLPYTLYLGGTEMLFAIIKVVVLFGIFCAVASAAYLTNDIMDREADRRHPKKKYRPIAAGTVSVSLALLTTVFLSVSAFVLSAAIGSWNLVGLVVAYMLISQVYNAGLKHAPLVDVLLVGMLYAVRVAAGFVATELYVQGWYMWAILAGLLGCCIVLVKRRSELLALGSSSSTRRTLMFYAVPGRLGRYYASLSAATTAVFVPAAFAINPFLSAVSALVAFSLYRLWKLVGKITEDTHPIDLVKGDMLLVSAVVIFAGSFGAAVFIK